MREHQGAPRQSLCLIPDDGDGPSANGPHAPAEPDLRVTSPKRLRLQVEQDEPGARAVWDAHRYKVALDAVAWPQSRPDNEAHDIAGDLPDLLVRQPLVRERRLTPPRVEPPGPTDFIGQVRGRSFDHWPADIAFQCICLSLLQEQFVDSTHRSLPHQHGAVSVDSGRRIRLAEVLEFSIRESYQSRRDNPRNPLIS